MFSDNENISFIKENIKEEISLPDSLSRENIEKLVSGRKKQKNKKGIIRKLVAVGVAACLMITVVAVFSDSDYFSPENTAEIMQDVSNSDAFSFDSKKEMLDYINAYAKEYRKDNKKNYYFGFNTKYEVDQDLAANSGAVAVPDVQYSSSSGIDSFGETNVRVEGVGEANTLITDGEYLYYIGQNSCVCIVKAEKDGSFTYMSDVEFNETENGAFIENILVHDLFIYKDILCVNYSEYKYDEKQGCDKSTGGTMLYDISDKENPVLMKNIALDGKYVSSRVIDGRLILITDYDITRYFIDCKDEEVYFPATYNSGERVTVDVKDISFGEEESPEGYINISITDLTDASLDTKIKSRLGFASETYCTKDTLYIMSAGYNSRARTFGFGAIRVSDEDLYTNITAFDISGETAEFKACTRVEGTIINSYAVDEYKGYLRMALNVGEETAVKILSSSLEDVSEIRGIAKGEIIRSARFMGDTVYFVTFMQTDPLFVADLSDPNSPEIVGELKIPGFSSYLHPVGNGLVLGIGSGGTEDGLDGSAKISLFDVSDPKKPTETDTLIFPDADVSSDPKAFVSTDDGSFLVCFRKWKGEEAVIDNGITLEYRMRTYIGAINLSINDKKLSLDNSYLAIGDNCFFAERVTYIGDIVYIYDKSSGIASFDRENGDFITSFNISDDFGFCETDVEASEILF